MGWRRSISRASSGIQGFEKHVVLKRILPQFAARTRASSRCSSTRRAWRRRYHANIAQVHDIGEVDGSYFFTMEYLHGEDLRRDHAGARSERSSDCRSSTRSRSSSTRAAGLHYAHEKKGPDGQLAGIVHRDVSPSNIVVTFDGGVKVVDFGIAKMSTDRTCRAAIRSRASWRTCRRSSCTTAPSIGASDVFALGVVLYEMTTHSRLFRRDVGDRDRAAGARGEHPLPSGRDRSTRARSRRS